MLPLRKRWHNASKRTTEREGRLLWFAATTPGDPHAPLSPEEEAEAIKKGTVLPTPDSDAVAHGTSKTAGEIEGVLNPHEPETPIDPETQRKNEAMRQQFQAVIDKAAENITKVNELKARMQSKTIREKLEKFGNPALLARWEEDIQTLNRETMNSVQEKDFAEAMKSFWEGDMSPQEFLNRQGDYLKELPYGFAEMGTMLQDNTEWMATEDPKSFAYSPDKWMTLNQSDRIQITQKCLGRVGLFEWITSKEGQYKQMEKALKKQEVLVESVENQANGIDVAMRAGLANQQGLVGAFKKIRWYSINDYLNGVKKYWEALTTTWQRRSDRMSSDIARRIGRAMKPFNYFPVYGEEVDRILDKQLDAKLNEEEEETKTRLEGNHAKWGELFSKPDGEFWHVVGTNANATRGILKYAASKGFLYDIDENLDDHSHPIYGVSLEAICFDWKMSGDEEKITSYFTALRGDNSSGREHEIDHGYKMEFDVENVPRFIKLVEHEMDEQNLWATAGVCKRAMERGLDGSVSAWLFTTIMSKLKQYPKLREQTPVAFFDIIGKLSMYQTAFTLGFAKGYRKQLRQWAISGDDEILKKTALKHFNVIEEDILAKDPSINPKTSKGRSRLNELLAQVLAAHIVELPGGYVNIFESRFEPYRTTITNMFAATAKPTDEDSDFATEDTEKAMLPEVVLKKILKYNSTFEFTAEDWVQGYFGSLLSMARRMKAIDDATMKEAYKNYCDELRQKMDLNFGSYRKEERASKQLSTMDKTSGKPAIASLIAENLLSWDVMKYAAFADPLKQQLYDEYPDFYWEHVHDPADPYNPADPASAIPKKKKKKEE